LLLLLLYTVSPLKKLLLNVEILLRGERGELRRRGIIRSVFGGGIAMLELLELPELVLDEQLLSLQELTPPVNSLAGDQRSAWEGSRLSCRGRG